MSKEAMIWIWILSLSSVTGIIISYFIKGRAGVVLAGLIPWLGLLAALLYQEYFVPYKGGGASMWPIAQLFGGTVAAFAGVAAYNAGRRIFGQGRKSNIQ